jgi:predicted  nucleic acid-binding Zn-ribbon protein
MRFRNVTMLVAIGLVAGCTYLHQKQDLAEGGPARREAEANAQLQAAKTQNQDLQDQNMALEREIDRNTRRVDAAQSELDRVSAELESARKRKAVTDAEYRRLKGEIAKTNSDLESTSMELNAGRVTGNVDVAAKERQIQALEQKKDELEKAIGMSTQP